MLSQSEIDDNISRYSKYFIENDRNHTSSWQWIFSKGTNISCFIQYLNSTNEEDRINDRIDFIRTIFYSLNTPFKFLFFYWTILVFILHKFNFKKPVMKIILAHFILRSLGDAIEEAGKLLPRYYSTKVTINQITNTTEFGCNYFSDTPEKHPLRWVLTRQLGIILWFSGEIIADWYPLLRTKAVVKNKSIRVVYGTCAMFNISKLAIIICHFFLWPSDLYKTEYGQYNQYHVDMFYFYYWVIHLIIIYSSMIYEFSVYRVLKKNVFQSMQSNEGFLKKFKSISEYRILISAIVSAIFLPIFSVTIFIKFYYFKEKNYHRLEFSFDEIRQSIVNIQYYMIFIDQIFLIFSKKQNTKMRSFMSYNGISSTKNGDFNDDANNSNRVH
ncbi:hypothetical protein LY90DRAFT_666117 [Neocallimastix californiae]|uniref:Uncharacterized protein n=1 Tax=Neocallimastix californiae TaxID=1754190 RepID=A0A1Y2EST9_9FUNG|nr:hypothetical protein LY90DRAFT_666117 [Neocallimastix californiae]|eukprot:ORY74638.1 hypothetical protein LY90DRAFT_666117 [Neocallimastix californiae]